jgi:hypothetical protein
MLFVTTPPFDSPRCSRLRFDYTDNCEQIIGDEVERVVAWTNGAGQTVRLRFKMKDADLYSFRFRRVNEPPKTTGNAL